MTPSGACTGRAPSRGTYTGKEDALGFLPRMLAQYEGTLRVEVVAMVAEEHHGFLK
jgi:hypothetical protein